MNEFKTNHLKKCLRIANIYLTAFSKIDTHKLLLNNNIDIIIAYFIYLRFQPIQIINMYYDLKQISNENIISYFNDNIFNDYHFDRLINLKGEFTNEK